MALHDASFVNNFNSAGPNSLPVTVASNANRALFITTLVTNITNSASAPTRNGQTATLLSGGNIAASSDIRLQHWVILNPTVGAYPVVVAISASDTEMYIGAVSMYNVNQTTPASAVISDTASSTNQPSSVSVTAGGTSDLVLDFLSMSQASVSTTPGSGQTEAFDRNVSGYRQLSASYKAGIAGSVTMTETTSNSSLNAKVHSAFVVYDAPVVAATAPDAPTSVTATAGNGQVSGAFTAPANNGGAAITGYTMTAYKVSDNTVAGSNTGTASPIAVTVANGTAVYLKAKATNSVGTGAESAASNSVTPSAANQAPIFTGTIGNITGTNAVAITPVDVHAMWSDPDANTLTYLASPAGTAWPAGLVVNATTGVITGTLATSTTTGLRVRASDGSLTVDSNAFSVTISAAVVNANFAASGTLKNLVTGATLPDGSYSVILRSKSNLAAAPVGVKTGLALVNGIMPAFSLAGPAAGTEYIYEPVNEAAPTIRGLALATAA